MPPIAVYCGMRVLCVGRHTYLSEHYCRVFAEAGAHCEPSVGAADVPQLAARFEPDVVVCDCDLITPALLEQWAVEPALAEVPVLAVSLTRRPDDSLPPELCGPAASIYLPSLDLAQRAALLASVHRPRSVPLPRDWRMHQDAPSAHLL
jgi:hypothetical protein